MSHIFIPTLLSGYNEGRRSVQEIVQLCRTYRGPEPHWLWHREHGGNERIICRCCTQLSGAKLFELLQLLIADDPRVPAITHNGNSFLGVALQQMPYVAVSTRVLLLLAVPEVARGTSSFGDTPLSRACAVAGDDPALINRLVDLDPDALMIPRFGTLLPLHTALVHSPTNPAVERMAAARPESLLFRNDLGRTPVEHSIRCAPPSARLASTLGRLLARCPRSVVPVPGGGPAATTALENACRRFHQHPDLIEAIVRSHPPALCLAAAPQHGEPARLPVDDAADRSRGGNQAFLREATVHLALAVVEYVLGCAAFADEEDATWFQTHVRNTVENFDSHWDRTATSSGFDAAQAVGTRDNAIDLVRGVFCHERTRNLLRGRGRVPNLAFGETVLDLYDLNRRGRVGDQTAAYQVGLLASLKDSGTVESTYLHFREVARHALIVDWRRRGRSRQPTTQRLTLTVGMPGSCRRRSMRCLIYYCTGNCSLDVR
jgi:hypothetical protein